MNVDPQSLVLTSRDVLLFGLFIAFRDGLPWLMRTVFPAVFQGKQALQAAELQLKREIAERELALKQENAAQQQVIEERTAKTLESIDRNLAGINHLLTAVVSQGAAQGQGIASLQSAADAYYAEGRQAMQSITIMASREEKKKR